MPGLSGSLLMYNMGVYYFVFECIENSNFINIKILFLIIGFIFGILIWSKLFVKILKNNKKWFKTIINGMSIGSIILMFLELEKYCVSKVNIILISIVSIVTLVFCFTINYFSKKVDENNKI